MLSKSHGLKSWFTALLTFDLTIGTHFWSPSLRILSLYFLLLVTFSVSLKEWIQESRDKERKEMQMS